MAEKSKTVKAPSVRKTVTKSKNKTPALEKTRKLTAYGLKKMMEKQRKH